MTYLIVIEAKGAGSAYHYLPYRLASSLDEARELMRDYMAHHADDDMCPDYFVLFRDRDGRFDGEPRYFDPCDLELREVQPTEWLQETGRC